MGAIVDLIEGAVVMLPTALCCINDTEDFAPYKFDLNSSLLKIRGKLRLDDVPREYYYKIEGSRLTPIGYTDAMSLDGTVQTPVSAYTPAQYQTSTEGTGSTAPSNDGDAIFYGTLAFVIFMYFFPTFVARSRHHLNTLAIFMANLFLGWTFIGWVACLVWACTNNTRSNAAQIMRAPF